MTDTREISDVFGEPKKYEELTFTDDFMFCKVLTNNLELCRELLEIILETKIQKVELSETQKNVKITYDGKGIRLDVYVEDSQNTVYDLEMQVADTKNLPKRSRYYQGMIDLNILNKGENYKNLKKAISYLSVNVQKNRNKRIYQKAVCRSRKGEKAGRMEGGVYDVVDERSGEYRKGYGAWTQRG